MKTIGEQRVRIDFNVSGDSKIDNIKRKSADLINVLEDIKTTTLFNENKFEDLNLKIKEFERLIELAQTAYEDACMWAVKAITI